MKYLFPHEQLDQGVLDENDMPSPTSTTMPKHSDEEVLMKMMNHLAIEEIHQRGLDENCMPSPTLTRVPKHADEKMLMKMTCHLSP
jgi:hypothetical protein